MFESISSFNIRLNEVKVCICSSAWVLIPLICSYLFTWLKGITDTYISTQTRAHMLTLYSITRSRPCTCSTRCEGRPWWCTSNDSPDGEGAQCTCIFYIQPCKSWLIVHLRICQGGTPAFPEQGHMNRAKLTLHALCGAQQVWTNWRLHGNFVHCVEAGTSLLRYTIASLTEAERLFLSCSPKFRLNLRHCESPLRQAQQPR